MKATKFLLALSVFISGAAIAADNHDTKPLHGGVVAQAKDVDYEIVSGAGKLQLYVRDHGKPADVSEMAANVTLLNGTEKQDVQLLPVDGRLEASGSFKLASGTKAVAAVTKGGKPVASVRFSVK